MYMGRMLIMVQRSFMSLRFLQSTKGPKEINEQIYNIHVQLSDSVRSQSMTKVELGQVF